jgi:methyl-accepting chemotaxis protein
MANKSVLELAVETGKWDSGLKKAKSALDKFTDASGGLQKALDADSEKMGKFVQMMGKADSTAKTGKGQMNDYKQAIEQLTMQFNRMTDAQKKTVGQDYLRTIDQLKQKYHGVSEEIQKMNQSLSGSGSSSSGGGLFGGGMSGMLQVFGGNLMTKAAGWAADFASEMGQAVQQGIELARQGEGIRNAFERLGRGDILNGLREATHGTVTDLELMKAAVKFNDFNLPLEELGTMLAFAQQKAKDTGQSVDYMVESITNGLGRQSKPILDNLGISAKEIEERMKSTGDFTKAVGEIVREQMTKAGDYIETAADRATKADVDLKNAMEELGRTLMPLEEQGVSMWTSLKTGAIELLNDGVKPLVPVIVDLKGEISDLYTTVSNSSVFNGLVNYMKASWEWCSNLIPVVRNLRKLMQGNDLAGGAGVAGVLGDVMSYNGGQLPNVTVTPPRISGGGKTVKGGARSSVATKVEEILPVGSVAALNKELSDLRKQQEVATDTAGWRAQQ